MADELDLALVQVRQLQQRVRVEPKALRQVLRELDAVDRRGHEALLHAYVEQACLGLGLGLGLGFALGLGLAAPYIC